MRILIVGLSTRAIAESAVRGGYGEHVVTLDYFGDRDQRSLVENHALMRDFDLPFSAEGLLQASRGLDCDTARSLSSLLYISNLENHPDVVTALARGRTLLGNTPETLAQVRDWGTLRTVCREESIPFPTTLLPSADDKHPADNKHPADDKHPEQQVKANPAVEWLRKPWRSGGGHGISRWDGKRLTPRHFLQAYVEGQPASAAFVADGKRSVLIGLTEQLIGREELGGRDFTWCGNILPLAVSDQHIIEEIAQMTNRLTRRFGLRGVNGIDLVIAGKSPYLIEVNPRYTASMELIERAYGLNIFSLHMAAIDGQLPDFNLRDHIDGPYFGKGIVYAGGHTTSARTVTIPETAAWITQGRRDIPHTGEIIEAGHPICTVLTKGASRADCWQRILTSAEAVYADIGHKT